ncbi:aminoimidazole riboside kinase [Texcoconibacillus texcoconensis]|uniref:Fructokinase n=1 Tax=Texcoconibacillus texcoconensis TaxID=1095777 RepID=A0A840QUR4_9BACI|nr:aminoimidazole riboside kinase [Texcoconibacillus texcoconensis]MBB5175018.1 fructokinase [Texcoconibacillus texcoconensis]
MIKGVLSLGEALIDFIPIDHDNLHFQKSPGGAPANVAVGLARLGAQSTFLGKVGDDVLGHYLKETLSSNGVHTNTMFLTTKARTGLTFVTIDENGERSFDFYIDPSADRFLQESEFDSSYLEGHNVLHFGSISMISEPAKTATKRAVEIAREREMIVSYDPNLRLGLWENEETARETIVSMLDQTDVLKISDEELTFITGEEELEEGMKELQKYNIPLIFVTKGAEGSDVFYGDGKHIHVPTMKVETVDTTGAGDAFVSGLLYRLHEREESIASITEEEAYDITRFASVSGALAASTKGAMTALPTYQQVQGEV